MLCSLRHVPTSPVSCVVQLRMLGFKGECKQMCFFWQSDVCKFLVHATKVAIICFRLADVNCCFDSCPSFWEVLRRSCHLKVINVNDKEIVEFLMVKDLMPNVRQNLFPSLFRYTAVEMLLPYTTTIRMSVQSQQHGNHGLSVLLFPILWPSVSAQRQPCRHPCEEGLYVRLNCISLFF